MDKIIIKNLEVYAYHGVMDEERRLGQKFFIDAELHTDLRYAGKTDRLDGTVNYASLCQKISEYTKENPRRLIEAAAEDIAYLALSEYPTVKEICVTVKKPSAPVVLPLEYPAVSVVRKRHTAYVALGSNMGDKEKYLTDAVKAVNDDKNCTVKAVSDFIVTEPVGGVEQDDFLNGCMEIETLLTPQELLELLNAVEKSAGRERLVHWGPRTLDLDIILYDDEIVNMKNLKIPHIEMTNRRFVLEPLSQIAPYAKNPVNGKTVTEMLADLQNV